MKRRLIGATLLTVLAALLVSVSMGIWVFHQREMDDARQNLRELLTLVSLGSPESDPQSVAAQFAQAAPDKRLTLIAADGTVLADTVADAAAMENHLNRAEVLQAASTGWGEAVRPSETVGRRMLYITMRFPGGVIGRVSTSISSINGLMWKSVGGIFLASLAALALSTALAGPIAGMVLRPLNAVGDALQAVLDGTQESPSLPRYERDGAVGPLMSSIDRLVEQLGRYIDDIRAERDKVNLVLDCMDEGLILLDQEGNILAINSAARRLFGLGEQAGTGSILHLTRSRRLRQALRQVRSEQEAAMFDLEDAALGDRSLRMFLSPVTGRRFEGETVGCSILVSDVTELKRAEGIRSEFTANVSHELKTPLTSIKGFTDMLSSGMVQSEEDRKRFLTMIGVEVDRLIDLINDILKLSELESVSIAQHSEAGNVLEEARSVQALLLPAAQQAEVSITVDGASAMAAIPAARLKELLLNLMENGVKYNEPGGTVSVQVSTLGDRVVLTVADTGIGIPPEAQSRVFERFYRVDRGRARKNGGTGLGLAIVKHIAQLYGGTLALESRPGVGSTFTITLPMSGK